LKGSIKGIVMLGLLTMGLGLDAAPKPGEGPRNSGDPINSLPTRNTYSTEVRARGPAIDNQSAARRVKERFRDRRILGIKLIQRRNKTLYQVKTLSAEGVVAFVNVDAESGALTQ
jgi:hypothetical protein